MTNCIFSTITWRLLSVRKFSITKARASASNFLFILLSHVDDFFSFLVWFFFARRFGIYIEQFCIRELMTCVFRKCSNKMNVIFFSCVYIRSTHVDWAKMRKHIRVGIHDAFAWGAYFYVSFQMNHSWASTRNECKFSCNCFFFLLFSFFNRLSLYALLQWNMSHDSLNVISFKRMRKFN